MCVSVCVCVCLCVWVFVCLWVCVFVGLCMCLPWRLNATNVHWSLYSWATCFLRNAVECAHKHTQTHTHIQTHTQTHAQTQTHTHKHTHTHTLNLACLHILRQPILRTYIHASTHTYINCIFGSCRFWCFRNKLYIQYAMYSQHCNTTLLRVHVCVHTTKYSPLLVVDWNGSQWNRCRSLANSCPGRRLSGQWLAVDTNLAWQPH